MTRRFSELARRRRMTRHFLRDPIDDALLAQVLDTARRVPSAGNTQGFDFVVLCGSAETARYWDVTLPSPRRDAFSWPSLLWCPVLVTVWADPAAYLRRYAEPDKADARPGGGLHGGSRPWPVPYWTVDAAFAALALQYAAIDEGLGVLFFGMFGHGEAVARELAVPAGHEPIGTVALGWPDRAARARGAAGASMHRSRRPLLTSKPAADTAADTAADSQQRPVAHRGRWMGRW